MLLSVCGALLVRRFPPHKVSPIKHLLEEKILASVARVISKVLMVKQKITSQIALQLETIKKKVLRHIKHLLQEKILAFDVGVTSKVLTVNAQIYLNIET